MNEYFPTIDGVNMSKLQLSKEGRYSVTKPIEATFIINNFYKRLASSKTDLVIVDGTANNGGDTINFALSNRVKKVYAIELDKANAAILKNNISVYNLNKKVDVLNTDFLKYYPTLKTNKTKVDLIMFDPPWGGREYKTSSNINLYLSMQNIGYIVKDIIQKDITECIMIKVPYNFNINAFNFFTKSENTCIFNIPNATFYVIFIKTISFS